MNENELSEKLVALSDGELSSSEASEVYQHLATNSALQEELNYHLKMKSVFKKIETPPPVHLKSNIMLSSGLTYVFWKTKSFIYSMVSSSLAVLAFFGYHYDILNIKDDAITLSSNNQLESRQHFEGKIILPKINSEYVNIEKISTNFKSQNNNQNQIVTNFANNKEEISNGASLNNNLDNNAIQKDAQFNIIDLDYASYSLINDLRSNQINQGSLSLIGNNINFQDNYNVSSFLSKLNVTFNKSISNNSIKLEINNQQQLDLNNASLALLYELSDDLQLGIEVNGEEFAQKFKTMVNDSIATYQQYYNSYYFGASAKYYLPVKIFYDRVSFYSRGLVGVTALGPVFRAGIGGEFYLYDKWSLIGSYDLSNLVFSVKGKINSTTKSGFNLGLKYDI